MAGIPARNLSDEEVKLFGLNRLLATGLYKKNKKKPIKKNEITKNKTKSEEKCL